MRPAVGSADRTGLLLKRIAKAKAAEEEVDPDELARFEEKARDIEKLLRRCSPARLALYEHNGLIFSAPLEVLRSEEHTSELPSLMRISYAVFCLKKKKPTSTQT